MKNAGGTKLFLMALLSFIAMYAIMYAMVDTFSDIYLNLDELYMVLLMTAAMILIEIAVMGAMYGRRVKIAWGIGAIAVFIAAFFFVRDQTAIGDREFLKAMISHHASAILMCEKAPLRDAEIKDLCATIVSSQADQIAWMKGKLGELR